jgi:hypothetical protein
LKSSTTTGRPSSRTHRPDSVPIQDRSKRTFIQVLPVFVFACCYV